MPAQVALHEGQGHPLKGVWLGDWGTGKTNRNQVVVEMDWDGKAITGSINPGLFFKVRHPPALRIRFGRG